MFAEWGYSKSNGPETWAKRFPMAAGSRQSPVNIETARAITNVPKSDMAPLRFKYTTDNCKTLVNTGYGWKVDCSGTGTELTGGPLRCKYTLEQFHCHWGPTEATGSEHTVDGKSYAGELHLVHWNSDKYPSFAEAAKHPDGLAVLAVFLKVGKGHSELLKITALLNKIVYKSERVDLNTLIAIDIEKLLPSTFNFWTYPGSLTTPPCSETVDWLILKEPVEVSKEQLAVFRRLRAYCREQQCPANDELNGHIVHNYRPTLSLGNREIRECGGH